MLNTLKRLAPDIGLAMLIFGLALWLRSTHLAHFVTADEHNWIYRSGLFLNAFLNEEWPGTSVWLTPGVTTTWLGSAGLAWYYHQHTEAINQPFLLWLISFSKNKISLEVLTELRWAMAWFTAGLLAGVYLLARQLWARPVALLGSLLLLLEPHLLAVSRIIGHDAPVTLLMAASLLSLLCARRSVRPYYWLMLSGALAGLGVLSKATALLLVPLVGLVFLFEAWQRPKRRRTWLGAGLVWLLALWLAFVLAWPAAWVAPAGKFVEVFNNAFLSSAGFEDADLQLTYATPELGYFYYLVNGLYKLSPALTMGLVLAAIAGWRETRRQQLSLRQFVSTDFAWLLLFSLIFGLVMSISVKRSPRYILPVFPPLAFIAAWGWLVLLRRASSAVVVAGIGGLSLLITLAYAPYYFTYFNPLLGGALTAPHVVGIGWGEGLDQVGRWLNTQPDAQADALGARYTATIHPFYTGQLSSPVKAGVDYVAFYIKQSQSGYPAPEVLAYFEAQGALHQVEIDGIDYAQIYRGPAMILTDNTSRPDFPIAYRPHTHYAPIGGSLTIDLLWADEFAPARGKRPVRLSLRSSDGNTIAESQASIRTIGPGVNVSQHTFSLPADLARETYQLSVNDQPLDTIKARLMELPPDFVLLDFIVQNLKLKGYRFEQVGQDLVVELAWQSWPQERTDFTVYVQLLDSQGQRQAGVDVVPTPGFSELDRKEVLITRYTIPLPADLTPGAYNLLVGMYYFAGDELINVGSATLPQSVQLKSLALQN